MSFKKVKVVMLSTNEKANLLLTGRNDLYYSSKLSVFSLKEDIDRFQHLYFLSDEEIKEGDWVVNLNSPYSHKELCRIDDTIELERYAKKVGNNCKKIIATTDEFLSEQIMYYPDGSIIGGMESYKILPQPSTSFIEKFVEEHNKGNVITEVLVEYETITKRYGSCSIGEGVTMNVEQLKVNPTDNTITIRKVKDSWNRDEVRELLITAYSKGRTNRILRDFNEWLEQNL